MNDLHVKSFNPSKKEIEEYIRRPKDLTWSGVSRINVLTMVILPKTMLGYTSPIKIPWQFFRDLEKGILNFIWKKRKAKIAETILQN